MTKTVSIFLCCILILGVVGCTKKPHSTGTSGSSSALLFQPSNISDSSCSSLVSSSGGDSSYDGSSKSLTSVKTTSSSIVPKAVNLLTNVSYFNDASRHILYFNGEDVPVVGAIANAEWYMNNGGRVYTNQTPPNYIKSTSTKHILNYAVDLARYSYCAGKLFHKNGLEVGSMISVNTELMDKYSFDAQLFNNLLRTYDNKLYNLYVSQGKFKVSAKQREDYIKKNNLTATGYVIMTYTDNVSPDLLTQAEKDLNAFLADYCKNDFDLSKFNALYTKYSYSKDNVGITDHSEFPKLSGKFTPGTYKIVKVKDRYLGTVVTCTVTFNPIERLKLSDDQVHEILFPMYQNYIYSEMKNIKVEINTNQLLEVYNKKLYIKK